MTFYSTPNVRPGPDELEEILTSCGAKYMQDIPTAKFDKQCPVYILANEKDQEQSLQLFKKGYPIHSIELVLSGVLLNTLQLDKFTLNF
jgi:hypothetical protein